MIDHGRYNVLGVRIDAVDYEAAIERVITAARERRPLSVSALAVHGLMTGVLDEAHRYRLNSFDMLVPDGQPVRWALDWLHGAKLEERVYGPNLMLRICQRAADEQLPILLFGGTDELLGVLEKNLTEQFPKLQIAGRLPSKFRRLEIEERDEVARTIQASGAAITFVGLGCPRQEVWAFEFRELLSMPLLAVGAAFNFHAGLLPQAPHWLQRRGLEWAFRLAQEPRRLWKRYMLLNPLFATLLVLQLTGVHTVNPELVRRLPEEIRYG